MEQLWQIEVFDEKTGEDRSAEFFEEYQLASPIGAWPSREAHLRLRYVSDWYALEAHYVLPGLKFRLARWQPDSALTFTAATRSGASGEKEDT